jgi:urease accessory protein UreH
MAKNSHWMKSTLSQEVKIFVDRGLIQAYNFSLVGKTQNLQRRKDMKTLALLFSTIILTGTVFATGVIDIAYSPYTIN